jgi:putative two-component system response regulator
VGKIGVPEAILQKAGRFTAEERHIMDTHASVGADLIVTASPDLAPVAALVRQHHERWDGRGYPAQLAGDEVSLGGRILHVADVFDAISSPRPYRRPLSPREAMDYLNDHMGTEFDPLVVDVFAAQFAAARIVHADAGDTTAKAAADPT